MPPARGGPGRQAFARATGVISMEAHGGKGARSVRCFWLDAPHGRVMIGPWAVLIGRNPDCNIVIEGAEISRHHALVRVGRAGAELLPLGRQPVRVNGASHQKLSSLRAGDRIDIGAWSFLLGEGEVEGDARAGKTAWFIERQTGLLQLVSGPVFQVGGGVTDDLIIPSWEPGVLSLDLRAGAPLLSAQRPGVCCGRALAEGERITLSADDRITYRDESLTVRAKSTQAGAETQHEAAPPSAVVVLLEFLPRGGQLTIEIGGSLHTTHLSDRRCDMVACLLQPPPPYHAGEFIPEDDLCARIWPGEKNGRTELNSLLYRLRQSLADEGVDPAPLFERKGGGLRFCLAPRARVVVR